MHRAITFHTFNQCKQTLKCCNLIGLQNSCSGYKSGYSDVTQPPTFPRGGWAPPNYGWCSWASPSMWLIMFCWVCQQWSWRLSPSLWWMNQQRKCWWHLATSAAGSSKERYQSPQLRAIKDWVQQFRCCFGAIFSSTFHVTYVYLELLNPCG